MQWQHRMVPKVCSKSCQAIIAMREKATSERHCGWCTECTNQVLCSRCTNPIMTVRKVQEKINPAFRYVCRRCGAYNRAIINEVLHHHLGHLAVSTKFHSCLPSMCEVRKNSDTVRSIEKASEGRTQRQPVSELTYLLLWNPPMPLVHDVVKKTITSS